MLARPALSIFSTVVFYASTLVPWNSAARAQDAYAPPNPLPQTSDIPANQSLPIAVESLVEPNEPPLPLQEQPAAQPGAQVELNGRPGEVSQYARRFRYSLVIDVRGAYDTNIALTPDGELKSYFLRVSPSLRLGFGEPTGDNNYVALTYSPDFYYYPDYSNFNTIQHYLKLDAQYRFSRLRLNISENFAIIESANLDYTAIINTTFGQFSIDISRRGREHLFNTLVDGAYDFSSKTSFVFGLTSNIADFSEGYNSSHDMAANAGIEWHYSDKLTAGARGVVGHVSVDQPSPDQDYEQANLTLRYNATGKLNFNGSAGMEFRQSDAHGGSDTTPVFQFAANWLPFDGTQIDLSASRRTFSSAVLAEQDFHSTQVVLTARQRFLQRMFLVLNAGFENQKYFSTITGSDGPREDNYWFIAPEIDVKITRYWYAGAYILRRTNDSSLDSFGFDDTQVGFRTTLTF